MFPKHDYGAAASLVEAAFARLPVMASVAAEPLAYAARPFAGLGVAVLLHLRATLVAMVAAWIGQGLDPAHLLVVAKDYDYPEAAYVRSALAALGVEVVPVEQLDAALPGFLARLAGRPLLVVEDGGHITPRVAAEPNFVGAIEQTTKGIRRVRAALGEPSLPLLSLPASRFKCAFEPVHVARSGVAAIAALVGGRACLKAMHATLIGAAGVIGAAMQDALACEVASLTAYDCREPEDFELLAFGRVRLAASAREAVERADLIIGATGECVLRPRDLARVKDGAVLASMGSERTEFPYELLERLAMRREPFRPDLEDLAAPAAGTVYTLHGGRRIVLLADGRPVNLSHAAPPEAPAFDLIMSAILAASIELAQGRYASERGFLDVFDELVVRHRLADLFLATHSGEDLA